VKGHVTLMGAGPGAADLLTVRAARALAACDLVLYDALVDPEVLALAARAHRFYVGKRRGRHSMDQETIHRLLIRAARRGKRVVRLKCGDPFVFGRGGEEAIALAEAGVPFDVIPGVSSALAGPLDAGIPVTHRGVASGFVVLPGEPSRMWREMLSAGPRNGLTYVILMALARRAEIAAFALAKGFSTELPAAIVLGAHTRNAWTWKGTLARLAGAEIPRDTRDLPGLLVLGDVVAVSERIARTRQEHAEYKEMDREHFLA
jgi:uroporphyrin-III C-methyltransferase